MHEYVYMYVLVRVHASPWQIIIQTCTCNVDRLLNSTVCSLRTPDMR